MVWLLALLTLGTAASVLWIVVEAMRSEQFAARQRWNEAAQLRLADARQRLEGFFSRRRVALLQLADLPPSQLFAAAVRDGIADSLICGTAADGESYPQAFIQGQASKAATPSPETAAGSGVELEAIAGRIISQAETNSVPQAAATAAADAWLAAQRAYFAEAAAATSPLEGPALPAGLAAVLRISEGFFAQPANRLLLSPDGRRVAAAGDFWVLQEFQENGHPPPAVLKERLKHELDDYSAPAMPAPQRRFLMQALAKLEDQPAATLFSTYEAETLAARYHLQKSAAVAFHLADRGPLLLFRPESLIQKLTTSAETPGLTFLTDTQPSEAGAATLEFHPVLPGWRLSIPAGPQDQATRRIALYGWIGGAFVLLLGGLTLLTWRHVRGQLRRARLQHDLAATVSHELRTPVASMRLLVESLQEDRRLDEEKTRDYLGLVARENQRLSQLIDNFLTLARLDRSGSAPAPGIPARELMERTAAAASAAGYGTRLRIHFPDGDPFLKADASLVETALLNLIDNACKFSAPDTEVLIRAVMEPSGKALRFSVIDQGTGLTPAEQERIWHPFERLPAHRVTHRGCGLGLSIVRRVALQSGGSVEIVSSPGNGSTFSLLLPATLTEIKSSGPPPATTLTPSSQNSPSP